MKKKVFLSVLMTILMVLPMQAQFHFGVTGGLTLNKVNLNEKVTTQVANNYTGWYIGPTVEVGVPIIGLKFDGSIQYAHNGASITDNSKDYRIDGNYISVPLNVKYVIGMSSLAGIYFAAGPQFDWAIGDKIYEIGGSKYALKNSQLSINLGAGVRLLNHLQVGAYYNIPCGKTAEADATSLSFKNKMWKLNVMVFF